MFMTFSIYINQRLVRGFRQGLGYLRDRQKRSRVTCRSSSNAAFYFDEYMLENIVYTLWIIARKFQASSEFGVFSAIDRDMMHLENFQVYKIHSVS